ncbi:NADH dehydrogenase [ubiquinone] 1 alpha subcomplex subunit 7 [Frankliniella fusca]|uniref:NADH dehydrogenase [ubiquinone] 1 alpha subcomplex subunit 7 n=1 Tax=Frankliniella fusca TaxID=407009 RepID=A0AAE1GTU1_9NEOP|nr:NADH dehydrogenase [ubiquinone] 1 alpha subcomplex subunit 7 [Frankliniella fusca]
MPGKVHPRDVTDIVAKFRNFLLGSRNGRNYLRFEGHGIAARTQPPPNLPDGPHAKLSANYYYTRDARRELNPPILLASDQKLLPPPKSVFSSLYRNYGH